MDARAVQRACQLHDLGRQRISGSGGSNKPTPGRLDADTRPFRVGPGPDSEFGQLLAETRHALTE